LAPAPEQGLLHRVLCEVRVAEDEPGDGPKPADLLFGEPGECLAIAMSRSLHELIAHRLPPDWPPVRPAIRR
jgi:hypothetical protein